MECVNEVRYIVKSKDRCEKVVRQHYIRDDISCGLRKCSTCRQENMRLIGKSVYAIFDHSVLLQQSDALQTDSLTDFIILQTALNYVSNTSKQIYKKIRQMIDNDEKSVFLFLNEFFRETYVMSHTEESILHRDARAYVAAVKWLNTHYSVNGCSVVLVTNTAERKADFIANGVNTMTFTEYVDMYYKDDTLLHDRIIQHVETGNTVLFKPYLPQEVLLKGISEKKYFQGTVRMNRLNYKEATVYTLQKEEILISGIDDMNRVVEGDVAVIELYPRSQWKKESAVISVAQETEGEAKDKNSVVDVTQDVEEHTPTTDQNAMETEGNPTGKVVGVLKRNWKPVPGYIKKEIGGNYSTNLLFLPTNKSYPPIRIKARDPARLASQRLLAVIDQWDTTSRYPTGHYVATLGNVGDRASETEAILELHDIPHYEFPETVLRCLPKLPFEITDEYLKGRRDFRRCNVCSIDPPGCKDIDDALHCKLLPNGHFEIGVHIADVSCFLKPNTTMDEEARKRGTTVYLADRRIDMLPKPLTEIVCSITEKTDTLTFSVVWEVDANGEIINCEYTKGIVNSYKAFAYGVAQGVIDNKEDQSDRAKELRALLMISKKLKQKRLEAGALVLASSEISIEKDEKYNPVGVKEYQTYETNSMVEEYMLLANVWVAKKIYDAFPQCALLRRHPPPDEHAFEWLSNVMKTRGQKLDFSSSKALSDSLANCESSKDPVVGKIMRILVTRCMQQAKYFSSGYFPMNEYRHYGLACDIYTHFTSPIRRYADVLVHRFLAMAIGFDRIELTITKESVKEIADNINYRHTMAQHAGRESIQMYTLIFYKDKEVEVDGYVVRVKGNGIVVNVPTCGLDVIVFLDPKLGFQINDKQNAVHNGRMKISVFDKIHGVLSIDKSNEFQLKPTLKITSPVIE
ncbi:exosome complex exonuclease RRP44, putative [Entamoeba invadens IP1]|uniref:Ribosomal RNA-processing protein 44 n=1 Tax=Entamoeba invadens IP1 TaxID=370355 RepID=A0A0A1U5W6_ENTIV|nr:exosome complex exonuclease RRP44, putative [Entamoeba invadens IP1]ELP89778.1 exosome complex exonuclease RRP44, putative [Entamoeba invadens IP1]|eukprot:XP_004256549.1 exosome complex exonuclease RRP44, putative [Entamoeba invadens IP1]